MGIEWKIGGRRVSASQMGRELAKSMEAGIEEELKKLVRGKRCAVHGQAARVEKHGNNWRINGCCDEFVQQFAS